RAKVAAPQHQREDGEKKGEQGNEGLAHRHRVANPATLPKRLRPAFALPAVMSNARLPDQPQTRLRPARFASYNLASAAISVSFSPAPGCSPLTPMLLVTTSAGSSVFQSKRSTAWRIFSQTLTALAAEVSGKQSRNSSPP